jgi:hypothetical protein
MNKKTKAHCNECHGERNHIILITEEKNYSNEEYDTHGSDRYEMLRCCGCDCVILRHTSWFYEEQEKNVYYYPPAMFRREPTWLFHLTGKEAKFARSLLKEIYIGVQNDLKMIATMGVRALVEHIMVSQVGDQDTFQKNIAEFAKQGFISEKQKTFLTVVLDAGHAAMHRSYSPSDKDLEICIDITENIMQSVYVHPDQAEDLKKSVPERKKRK